ncbi:MAG: DUF937 domain-containing protein [Candidatus Aminicenantes bacterium]|nr:DUF937 domain-containing protein [Candidatus Aminicenantes bacterium]
MASIIEVLMDQLSGEPLGKISNQLGARKRDTAKAMPEVLGLLTEALARNSSRKEGAQALSTALAKDHDGSILDNLPDFIDHFQDGPGDGILRHVLGDKRSTVEERLSKKSSLDIGSVTNLLTMLAPLVMGFLGRSQKQEGLDANSLAGLLGAEREQARRVAPKSTGLLGQLLDADGDGDITDDVVKIGGGLLGRLFRKKR